MPALPTFTFTTPIHLHFLQVFPVTISLTLDSRDRDPYREREKPETMDPDCAICSSPAIAQCDCEAKGLDTAVRQAETRMMTTFFSDIR